MRNGWRTRVLGWLESLPEWQLVGWTAMLFVLVAVVDWFSTAAIASSLGYLLPVSLAAWLGRRRTMVVAALCAGAWLIVDLVTHHHAVTTTDEVVDLIVLAVALQLFGSLLVTVREQLEQARRLAHTDALTGVHNLRAFHAALGRELERCRRDGTPFSLAYLDVDGFKGVNDRFGHEAGDELLRGIAQALQYDLRQLDMVARLGGDEFALLLPGTGVLGAGTAVTRALARLAEPGWQAAYDIDFSVGCLTVATAPAEAEEVVARADALMYAVKKSGRGQVRYDVLPSPHESAVPRLEAAVARRRSPGVGSRLAT